MRHSVFLTIVLALSVTALAQDWEGDLLGAEAKGDLHGTVGATYDSKYIWRGFDMYDDKSAVHMLADLNLFDTGFGVSVVGHRANSSGFEDLERWDSTLYYQNGFFQGERFATNFRVGWGYWSHVHRNGGESIDLQEGQAVLSWPNILPIAGLCPSYVVQKFWPAEGGSLLGDTASGFLHIFMLDYGFTIQGFLPDVPEQLIRLHGEVVYNDGFDPYGRRMDHDWSHAVFGISTDVPIGNNITLTPSVYYQTALEPILTDHNEECDEVWASVGLKYSF